MKRPTIRDVAQRAGVSISAVSYILNGSDKKKYAPETVERVRQAAQELAYVPSSIARSMRARQAHTLGVVTYWSMGERVFVKLLEGIVARAARENYAVLLCPQGAQLEYYQNGRMDGVIYVAPPSGNRLCEEEADVRAMREAGIPCVIIHGQSRLPDVNYLYFDFYNAIEALVSYLTDQGYREITYVAPEPDGAADGPELTERLRGYTETMRARGLAPDFCPDTRIAERMPDFRAVIANKSDTARRVLHLALEQGYRVPEDFPVVAGNTENYSEYLYPPLTTTQFPFEQMGERAAEVLLGQIRGEQTPVVEYARCSVLRHQSG